MKPTEPDRMSPLRLAQRRAAYEHTLAQRSALLAIDTIRYERWLDAIAACWPMDDAREETAVDEHLAETERLTNLLLNTMARLAQHIEAGL